MNVLIIGRGGREHAICRKVKESPLVDRVFAAPGNPGMEDCADCIPIEETDHKALIRFAKEEGVGLAIIGPEAPLLAGLADKFAEVGVKVFGPSKKAAEIEGSKSFAKKLMEKYGIPTATFRVFDHFEEAKAYLQASGVPIVIKADGLAAGKGVTVALTEQEAFEALEELLIHKKFGDASARVVIEEFLQGEEFSLMAFVNGTTVIPLEVARDHKRAYDGDRGPNTGGMGAYSPVPLISKETVQKAVKGILEPIARALVEEGRSFTGVLYAGLIQTKEGPKVIEFNARFGDPETEVVLPRLKSDFVEAVLQLLDGKKPELEWEKDTVLGVVLASKGYPIRYETGKPLPGLKRLGKEVLLFHAGTARNEAGQLVTDGGRVLFTATKAETLEKARKQIYGELEKLDVKHLYYRTDIGAKHL